MATIGSFRADPKKQQGGVWQEFGDDGFELKIASANNPEAKKAFNKAIAKKRGRRKGSGLELEPIQKQVYAKYVLLDWRGLNEDDDETEIPYSPEKALEFFNNPALAEIWDFVVLTAQDNELFREEDLEESAKN